MSTPRFLAASLLLATACQAPGGGSGTGGGTIPDIFLGDCPIVIRPDESSLSFDIDFGLRPDIGQDVEYVAEVTVASTDTTTFSFVDGSGNPVEWGNLTNGSQLTVTIVPPSQPEGRVATESDPTITVSGPNGRSSSMSGWLSVSNGVVEPMSTYGFGRAQATEPAYVTVILSVLSGQISFDFLDE